MERKTVKFAQEVIYEKQNFKRIIVCQHDRSYADGLRQCIAGSGSGA